MMDVGFTEALLIGALVLLFFKPEELPDLFRVLGRWYGKIRRASDDLRRTFNAEVARVDSDRRRDDLEKRMKSLRNPELPADSGPRPAAKAPPPEEP